MKITRSIRSDFWFFKMALLEGICLDQISIYLAGSFVYICLGLYLTQAELMDILLGPLWSSREYYLTYLENDVMRQSCGFHLAM